MDVAMPHLVRVAQGKDVWLYLQPTLSTRVKTEDLEMVLNAELRLRPTGPIAGSDEPKFFWDETGSWTYDHERRDLTYRREADPVPLIVSQDRPQQPTILFNAIDWNLRPGRYEGSLSLHRASKSKPLVSGFCLEISEQAVKGFRSAGQRGHFDFRDDVPSSTTSKGRDCYRLSPV
ncbi:hypothetical protein [Streptomyces sp. NPDC048349]|uniref:hypothetical protein n=1 Tax=Streptomyces sp. NPDC048349 TaxID=3155486 RepID=UPI0034324AE5